MQQEAQWQDKLSWPLVLISMSRYQCNAIWELEPMRSSCPYGDDGAGVLGVPPASGVTLPAQQV